MESPQALSSPRARSVKTLDDVTSLTSFNPFAEDEHENSSYALVSSLFSTLKSTFAAAQSTTPSAVPRDTAGSETSRKAASHASAPSTRTRAERRPVITVAPSKPAPPLMSLTPVISEQPTYIPEADLSHLRGTSSYTSPADADMLYNTAIPGFPIQDDARSIRTVASVKRNGSVSKVIRRLRGEGLSRDYWMDDNHCKECYDCNSVFSTWRRKHHCRICGQIFCSRCASNIIKGSRFGQDGMVRVCNLCLKMLEEANLDDDDDRRSVTSMATTSFPAHQLEPSSYYQSQYPQSPFAASQVFSKTDEPFSLFSIAEANLKRRGMFGASGDDEFGSGGPFASSVDDNMWDEGVHAPFRRGFVDEEKDIVPPENLYVNAVDAASPPPPPTMKAVVAPKVHPISITKPDIQTSSIEFPGSSPDRTDSPRPLRSRVSSFATDRDVPTPFLRSRVSSRLSELGIGEAGWRTRRESSAYAAELNAVSMFHLRIMLHQMITKENIPHAKEWEETLLKLALRVAYSLTNSARAPGALMDARGYVKIKKLPGGAPRDSEFVQGAVISKNLAHKSMPRRIESPRIMLVTFPFDYHRVEGQFMPLEPLVAQEKEYLKGLVRRVSALRPHVVLVERTVSRTALEYLLKANIAVARSVKMSSIQTISRMTAADVISSMDRLVLEPRLGQCPRFRIQTFEHAMIPGRRKTLMRFEGCSRETGCTLILRGENLDTLRRIKAVARFMVFIVRNLKMESYLWKDSVVTMPPVTADAAPSHILRSRQAGAGASGSGSGSGGGTTTATTSPAPSPLRQCLTISSSASSMMAGDGRTPTTYSSASWMTCPETAEGGHTPGTGTSDIFEEELTEEELARTQLSRRIQQSLEPYLTNFISASATLRFPPPYPITRMKELDERLHRLRKEYEDREADRIFQEERGHFADITLTAADIGPGGSGFGAGGGGGAMMSPALLLTPDGTTPSASSNASSAGYFGYKLSRSVSQTSLSSQSVVFPNSNANSNGNGNAPAKGLQLTLDPGVPPAAPVALHSVSEIAAESAYRQAQFEHEEQRRIWEWYLRKNKDDFVVEKYQSLSVRYSIIPTVELDVPKPCFMPTLRYMTYYGENDCTLGQFIEDSCMESLDPTKICAGKGCTKAIGSHSKVYYHNETRLLVATEPWSGKIGDKRLLAPMFDQITTWSLCRVCMQSTPFIPLSDETYTYSFAKFLELHFYPADVMLMSGAGCSHNIYLDHMRYFALRGMTVRFQTDPIELFELSFPPVHTRVEPESLLELKNRDYEHMLHRNNAYWTSVVARITQLQKHCDKNCDYYTPQEKITVAPHVTACKEMLERAAEDRKHITALIHEKYRGSSPMDTLALGSVRPAMQNKVVQWDNEFERFEKAYLPPRTYVPTERDLRRMTGTQHFKRLADFFGTAGNSEVDEKRYPRGKIMDSFPQSSSASENESAPEREKFPSQSDVEHEEEKEIPLVLKALPADIMQESLPKSDADSDSTISAARTRPLIPEEAVPSAVVNEESASGSEEMNERARRPRRPSVAEIVKQFQEEAREAALQAAQPEPPAAPPMSGSEAEIGALPRRRGRAKVAPGRFKTIVKKRSFTSDFERSYAANVGPKHLQATRRPGSRASRISANTHNAYDSMAESRMQSRQTSPTRTIHFSTKRPTVHRVTSNSAYKTLNSGRKSPTTDRRPSASPNINRNGKGKALPRVNAVRERERTQSTASTMTIKAGGTPRKPGPQPGKVASLAREWERRLAIKDSEPHRGYAVLKGRRARPVAVARVKVEIYDNISDAVRDEMESEVDSSSSSEADDEDDGDDFGKGRLLEDAAEDSTATPVDSSEPPSESHSSSTPTVVDRDSTETPLALPPATKTFDLTITGPDTAPPSPAMSNPYLEDSLIHSPPSDVDGAGPSLSVIHTVSSWLRPHPAYVPLQYPSLPAEHVFAEDSHTIRENEGISITIREDEPTSIIAFTLSSPQHRESMNKAKDQRQPKAENEVFMPDDTSTGSTYSLINKDEIPEPAELLRNPVKSTHQSFQFESNGVHISCMVFCAEQFEALRQSCGCQDTIIESLARCVKWNAAGGKSGSAFLKTRDDRFIAKELTKSELDAMTKFAPAYFDYMTSALSSNRPTLLAKIFGCYKIAFKNPVLRKTVRMNLLIMENLFYHRKFSKIYDLKGSMRNRHVQSTGRENEVLLDENLMQNLHQKPFFLREHSKRILRGALLNDSKFLANLNIMDYSLLVAVDSTSNQIVVGIVDFIRTYTWDKKLESWVKESAFLGSGKGEPTIVTPKQYMTRFQSAMERYFPLVPDRWLKQPYIPDNKSDELGETWPDW